jgi:hypothetical protein
MLDKTGKIGIMIEKRFGGKK